MFIEIEERLLAQEGEIELVAVLNVLQAMIIVCIADTACIRWICSTCGRGFTCTLLSVKGRRVDC